MNADAFEDLLAARGARRKEVADGAGIALSTLTGLTSVRRDGARVGASRAVAERIAATLACRPGTLFPDLATLPMRSRPRNDRDGTGAERDAGRAGPPDGGGDRLAPRKPVDAVVRWPRASMNVRDTCGPSAGVTRRAAASRPRPVAPTRPRTAR